MSDLAQEIINRQERIKSNRSTFERQWHEIALRVLPREDSFLNKSQPGQRKDQFVFDSTAPLALTRFAAAMESMLTPRSQVWHGLEPLNIKLKKSKATMVYLESIRDLLFRVRYAPSANFSSQCNELYMNLGAFGTGAMFIKDALHEGIKYVSIPLPELFIAQDDNGLVDTVYRRYEMTARAAWRKWRDAVPEKIMQAVAKDPEKTFEFIHCVRPNDEVEYGKLNRRGMKYSSVDISIEGKAILNQGGFRTFPYAVSRYITGAGEVYGRSPAQDALADIRTLNEMEKTNLRYGQRVNDPPLLAADVDSLSPFSMKSGAINAGFLSENGTEMVKPLLIQGDPRFALEQSQQKRKAINDSFLVTLFQILVDTPQMTATEVMERAQEKGALLAPTMGRQEAEFLGPLITREIDILANAGALPPPPPDMLESGGKIHIIYDNPLSRVRRAGEGVGILRTIESLMPVAQADPRVLKRFNFDRITQRLSEVNGVPADCLYSDAEMKNIDAANAQQAQMQNILQAAPIAAQTAKTLAQAGQASQQAPF